MCPALWRYPSKQTIIKTIEQRLLDDRTTLCNKIESSLLNSGLIDDIKLVHMRVLLLLLFAGYPDKLIKQCLQLLDIQHWIAQLKESILDINQELTPELGCIIVQEKITSFQQAILDIISEATSSISQRDGIFNSSLQNKLELTLLKLTNVARYEFGSLEGIQTLFAIEPKVEKTRSSRNNTNNQAVAHRLTLGGTIQPPTTTTIAPITDSSEVTPEIDFESGKEQDGGCVIS